MSVGPQSSPGGNPNITDPENPFQTGPASTYAPPPAPPLPPPEPTGHEQSFDSIVATQLATDYPDVSYSGSDTPAAPPPVTAADYFALGGNPATPSTGPGPTTPEPSPWDYGVGFEQYFGSEAMVDPQRIADAYTSDVQRQVTDLIGAPPQIGDATDSASQVGSNWYQSDESYQQQLGWLKSEAEKAMQFGDAVITYGNGTGLTGTAYLEQLQGEADRVNAAFSGYQEKLDTWQQHADTLLPHILPDIIAETQKRYQQPDPAGQQFVTSHAMPTQAELAAWETDAQRMRAQQAAQEVYQQAIADGQSQAQAAGHRDFTYLQALTAFDTYQKARDQQIASVGFGPRGGDTVRVDPITGTHYDANGNLIAPTLGPTGPTLLESTAGALGSAIDFFGSARLPGTDIPALGAAAHLTPFGAIAERAGQATIPGLPDTTISSLAQQAAGSRVFSVPAQTVSLAAAQIERPAFAALGQVGAAIGTALPSDLGGQGDLTGALGHLSLAADQVRNLTQTTNWTQQGRQAGLSPAKFIEALQQDQVQAQSYLDEHPFLNIGNQLVLDPWNLVGPHVLFEFAPATAKAGEFTHLALLSRANYLLKDAAETRSLRTLIAEGKVEQSVLTALAQVPPSWNDLLHLRWADAYLTRRLGAVTVPQAIRDAGYAGDFTKLVTLKATVNLRAEPNQAEALRRIFDEEAQRLLERVHAEQPAAVVRQVERLITQVTDLSPRDEATLLAMLSVSNTPASESGIITDPSFRRLYEQPVPRGPIVKALPPLSATALRGEGITADALAIFPNGDIVPFSRVAGSVKRFARVVPEAGRFPQIVKGLDGSYMTRAQYEADLALTKLRTTEPPRPVIERIVTQPPPVPTGPALQAPLVMPPSIPVPVGVDQPVVDLSNSLQRATQALEQNAKLDGSRLGSDVTRHQLDLLQFFTQRDGEDRIAQLLLDPANLGPDGRVGYAQASRLIQELDTVGADGRVLATLGQVQFLVMHGATDEEIANLARMGRDEASRFIDQYIGQVPIPDVDRSRFTTVADFLAQQSATTTRPDAATLPEREVILAHSRGQQYGRDFLAELLGPMPERPMLPARMRFNLHYIDPSPMQLRTLRGLQRLAEEGNQAFTFLRDVDLTTLKADGAITLLRQALGDEVGFALRGVPDAPTTIATAADIRDLTRAAEVVAAKDSGADYLDTMLPRVSTSETQPGFPKMAAVEGFGTTRGVAVNGVARMSPFAVQDLVLRNLDQHAGTLFEAPMRDIVSSYIFVKQSGVPSLTSGEQSFNRAIDALIETARQNPHADETERVVALFRNAYHSDARTAALAEETKKTARAGMDAAERERLDANLTLYRQQAPAQAAEIARLRGLQATLTAGTPGYDRLGQRIDFLTEQTGRMEDYLKQYEFTSTRKPPGGNPKMDAINARLDKYRDLFPDLPASPDLAAPLTDAAGPASTLDAVDSMMTGHLRSSDNANPFTIPQQDELPAPVKDPRWVAIERQQPETRIETLTAMSDQDLKDIHTSVRFDPTVKPSALGDLDTVLYDKGLPSIQGDMDTVKKLLIDPDLPEVEFAQVREAAERILGPLQHGDAEEIAMRYVDWEMAGNDWRQFEDDPLAMYREARQAAGLEMTVGANPRPRTYGDLHTRVSNLESKARRGNLSSRERADLKKFRNQMSAIETRYGGSGQVPDDLLLFKHTEATPAIQARLARVTHTGDPVLNYPIRRMETPIDARLHGPERSRVSGEIATTLGALGVPDDHIAVAQAMVDRFALAAAENNPERYATSGDFFSRMHVMQGEEGLTFNVDETGHAHLYEPGTQLAYGGSFQGRAGGGGLIQVFAGQDPGASMMAFFHEFGHLATSVLNEQQIRTLEVLLGVKDGVFTPAHREEIAKSFEAWWVNRRQPQLVRDILAQNPAVQSIFQVWRGVLIDAWKSVKGYFGKDTLTPEMYRFWEEASGGGTGMYKGGTYTSRLSRQMFTGLAPTGRVLRHPNVVDPLRTAGKAIIGQLDEFGPKFQSWVESFYNNDALLNDQRRFMLGGKVINPKALTDMSQVVQVGDLTSFIFHGFMDGDYARLFQGGNLDYETFRGIIETIRDTPVDQLATLPGYEHLASSKAMLEATRVIKAHAESVLGQFESLIPHQSMGDLIPQGIFPRPTNGRWTKANLEEVDKIINDQKNPAGWSKMTPGDKQALRDFRTSYKDLWNKEVRGRYIVNNEWQAVDPALHTHRDAMARVVDQARADNNLLKQAVEDYKLNTHPGATGRPRTKVEQAEIVRRENQAKQAGRDLSLAIRNHGVADAEVKAADGIHIFEGIDKHLFKWDPSQTFDLPKFADHLGSAFGQAHANAIGFNPNSLPLGMRSALFFKGQLTPLWMTLWPQYHLNNLAGNWMAQVVGAMRSDIHVNALPSRNGRVMAQQDRLRSGWVQHQYLRSDFTRGAAANVGRYRAAAGLERGQVQRALPKFLDYITGGFRGEGKRGAVTVSGDAANFVEDRFKQISMTQSQGWHFAHRWNSELADLQKAGTITRDARLKLATTMGLDEMAATAADLGLDAEATRQVLAAGRGSIANANLQAYSETRTMLRDYRYRNKLDGFLDKFLPVHYWSTKNFAFMTRSALDRPALSIGAAYAYDAWQKENDHLPPSLRTGYLNVPFDHPALSWIPGVTDKTWHMRLTNLTNPVLWAVPRIMGRWDWHGEDSSAWQRFAHVASDGFANFWEASGYRASPLYDMAAVVGNAWRTQLGDKMPENVATQMASRLLNGVNFLTSPGLDNNLNQTEGYRRGVLQGFLPFGGLEGLPMRAGKAQLLGEFLNKQVYGSAYTVNETTQIAYGILAAEQHGTLDHDTATRLTEALWKGQLDEPGLRPYIDNFWGGRSNSYLLARGLAVSGKTYTDTWRQQYQGIQEYFDRAKSEGKQFDDWGLLSTFHPATRTLIEQYRSGAIDDKAFQAAIAAARDGQPNALLQRAWQQTQGLDAQVSGDVTFWKHMADDLATYQQKAKSAGYAAANTWAYGWKNSVTGKVEDAHAPWISTYFLVTQNTRESAEASINRSDQRAISDAASAMADEYYATKNAQANRAAPYYAKLDLIRQSGDDGKQRALALGHDETKADGTVVRVPNMILWDDAVRAEKQGVRMVYDQAQRDGVPMIGGTFPRHGQTFYESLGSESMAIQVPGQNQQVYLRGGPRASDFRHTLIQANDALGAVDQYETKQAQENWLLRNIKGQIAPTLFLDDGTPNPDYKIMDKDGQGWHFDMQAYEQDRQVAADQAQGLSFELVRNLRNNGANVTVGGITREQFLAYTADKDPENTKWLAQKSKDIDAAFALPGAWDANGTYDQGRADAKQQAFADLKTKYGDGVLDKDYRGVANNDVLYNQGGKAIQTYYQTLTPAQKDWFKERYGSAFHEEPNADAKSGTRDVLDVKALSFEQVQEIISQQHLDIFGEQNTRSEVASGQITPYTMNKVASDAATQATTDRIYALQTAYYDGAGLSADQIDHNKQWLAFLDQNSPLEEQAAALRGEKGPYQPTWNETYDLAVKQDGEASPLAQYIAARIDTSKRLDVTEVYSAQTDWWHSLDGETRKLLMAEAPKTFGQYSDEPSDQAYALIKEYKAGAGLTPDQLEHRTAWDAFTLDHSSFERAANAERATGTPDQLSWKATIRKAQQEGKYDLADYITLRTQTFADLAMGETYDAQRAWWGSLSDDQRATLLAEAPDTFAWLTDTSGATTTASGGGGGGNAGGASAGGSRGGATARKASVGGGGSSSRVSAGAGAGSASTATIDLVRGTDPFFASGADDGRGEYAQKVSDWIDGQMFANFQPGKAGGPMDFIFQFVRFQMLHFIGQYLGPQPSAWDWQQLWNRLTQGGKYLRQPPPIVPPTEATPTPASPDVLGTTPDLALAGVGQRGSLRYE